MPEQALAASRPSASALDLTPHTLDTDAPDSVVIAGIPRHMLDSTACQQCSESGTLAVAYYTGPRRDGQFYACSVDHADQVIRSRARDLFPKRPMTATCYFCPAAVDPETDWLIFDTSVGSFEIVACDEHFDPVPPMPNSALAVVERCMAYPVVHGEPR